MKKANTLTIALLAATSATMLMMETASTEPLASIDHIILGVADLDQGIEEFERLTGVRPAYGGKHPTGTHNALVSIGGRTFLEILAVQPGNSPPPGFLDLPGLKTLTLVGWAITVEDLSRTKDQLASAGLSITEPRKGSRVREHGGNLHWQMFDLKVALDEAPFFIEWGQGSAHPSSTSPKGCSLKSWTISDPKSDVLGKLRTALDLPVTIAGAPAPAMSLALTCPTGLVKFQSASQEQQ